MDIARIEPLIESTVGVFRDMPGEDPGYLNPYLRTATVPASGTSAPSSASWPAGVPIIGIPFKIEAGRSACPSACAVASAVVFVNFIFIRYTKRLIAGSIFDCAVIFAFDYCLTLAGGGSGSGVLWISTDPLMTLFLLGAVWKRNCCGT